MIPKLGLFGQETIEIRLERIKFPLVEANLLNVEDVECAADILCDVFVPC